MLPCINSLVLQPATANRAAGIAVSVCIVSVLFAESAAAMLCDQDHNAHCVRATFQDFFLPASNACAWPCCEVLSAVMHLFLTCAP
jgi:hypothetical protein